MDSASAQKETAATLAAGSSLPGASASGFIDSHFWPSFLMSAALTSIAIGIVWDISWHETIGRDTFWTPAHMAIYLGGVLAGCTGGWLAIKNTFFPKRNDRDSTVRVLGAHAPLGAWIAIWGALAMITSGPFDDWWHNAYGLDVKIISPPHVILGLGMFGISVGSLLMVLARQNQLQETSHKGAGLFIYTGGVFVLMGTVFILEFIFPNAQHGARFYIVCALMYPARLVAMSRAGRVTWPATKVAAVYMAFMLAMDWVLQLFPAQPKLAPIFNPVTHMVPLPFPLLIIFPAMAIDLTLRWAGGARGKLARIGLAVLLGAIFFAVLLAVQWHFSKFMISPAAKNHIFMGNLHWGYNVAGGDWQTRFWDVNRKHGGSDTLNLQRIAVVWLLSAVGAWLGLFFGDWMRRIRR